MAKRRTRQQFRRAIKERELKSGDEHASLRQTFARLQRERREEERREGDTSWA